MARYQKGNFSSFSKAERVMAMQMYARKIQEKLNTKEISDFFAAHDELEELSTKAERAKSTDVFNVKEFLGYVKQFNNNKAYQEAVMARIASAPAVKKSR